MFSSFVRSGCCEAAGFVVGASAVVQEDASIPSTTIDAAVALDGVMTILCRCSCGGYREQHPRSMGRLGCHSRAFGVRNR
jgi:hypothetical protein